MKRLAIPLAGAAIIGGALAGAGLTAFAASDSGSGTAASIAADVKGFFGDRGPMMGGQGMRQGASGTISSINGTTIVVAGANGATYTIDASGATVTKFNTDGTSSSVGIAGLAVGDTIRVGGSVTSASITATSISTGTLPKPILPLAGGTVTAVNGSTITISGYARPSAPGTKPALTTYTIDTSSATLLKVTAPSAKGEKPSETTITAAQVAVGDKVAVEGTLSGTTITATKIIDGAGFPGRGMGMGHGSGLFGGAHTDTGGN